MFIADGDFRIREVNLSTGVITTVAGNGTCGPSGDNGQATAAELGSVDGLAADASGHLFIAEGVGVREVDLSTGVITTVWQGMAYGVAVDSAGHLFIAPWWGSQIQEIDLATGTATTIAGNATSGFSGDGGQAIQAQLNSPDGVAVDSAGSLYIVDYGNQRIREIAPDTWRRSPRALLRSASAMREGSGMGCRSRRLPPWRARSAAWMRRPRPAWKASSRR